MLNKSNGIADFVAASKAVTPAVVHIKTLLKPSTGKLILETLSHAIQQRSCNGFRFWYFNNPDGYIATNNHVIENASDIKVILPDKRIFSRINCRDPNTDLSF
jgi:S1-C subfamily serine protease